MLAYQSIRKIVGHMIKKIDYKINYELKILLVREILT